MISRYEGLIVEVLTSYWLQVRILHEYCAGTARASIYCASVRVTITDRESKKHSAHK